MYRLVECVPNFSEGRDRKTVERLVAAAQSVNSVTLADWSSDIDHNRSVLTLIGPPDAVGEAAVLLAEKAAELIDMNRHTGGHPRIGAADVIPFVPLQSVSFDECIKLSIETAKEIGERLKIPVYLYALSARGEHRNLSDIRRGGFEKLAKRMKDPEHRPDYGPGTPHPTAGAAAVGARAPLIAYNVNLNSPDLRIAKKIAAAVRNDPAMIGRVKAIGVMLNSRDLAQVSMNVTGFGGSTLYDIFDFIQVKAGEYNAEALESEIIGLTPRAALPLGPGPLRLRDFDMNTRLIESYYQSS